jgi:hypothetical protein
MGAASKEMREGTMDRRGNGESEGVGLSWGARPGSYTPERQCRLRKWRRGGMISQGKGIIAI